MSGAGRWVIAVSILILAGCSKPEEVISSRIAEANQKLEAGKAGDAVQILERLDRSYPEKPAILEALGLAYAKAGNARGAATSFVHAADLDKNSSILRPLAAEAYVRDGALDRAAEQHRLYLAEFPGDYQSWQKLGEIEEQRGNVARAIDAYLEWYRIRPEGEAAYRLGAAFRKLNNAPQAKTWFEATIKQGDAHVSDALLGLLELERDASDLAAAERTVGQIDRNFPGVLAASPLESVRAQIATWKEAEVKLAAVRAEQEKVAREIEEARRRAQSEATAPATTSPPTPDRAGSTTQPPAPPAETPRVTPESRPKPRSDLPPALVAANERREAGDTEKAIEILWRALGNNDRQVDLWIELADCYRELKKFAEAGSCMLEARRLSPDSLEIETAYLNLVRESEPMEKYLDCVEEARRKFPSNANFAYVFAHELANGSGTAARTVEAYEDFLLLADAKDPRRTEASEFLARHRRR